MLGIIFGTIDYIFAKNGKTPIFKIKSVGYTKENLFLENTGYRYGGLRYNATEYYGLGYKVVVCDSCDKQVYFMPFGIGTYAWFIGVPIDKLNGRWFHATNNDIYLMFDGVGYYTFTVNSKLKEEGKYNLEDDSVTLTSKNKEIINCTIKNNYHELYCDKYAELFMK